MAETTRSERSVGLGAAVGVGVGAIVGGGVLALAGVAFAVAGPAAIIAFAINGAIALLTARSFAQMSSIFPESGGTYAFAKKVFSIRSAFAVGWIIWFASIVAGVLYARGFGAFAVLFLSRILRITVGEAPSSITGARAETIAAVAATAWYSFSLLRRSGGGGRWATPGKVILFAVLIGAGVWVLIREPRGAVIADLVPLFPFGVKGLVLAMGYTFIALQGFDLIAAVAGEIREPQKNIPRAMNISLLIAVGIYVPFLFIIATVGVPKGASITALSADHPDMVVAAAVENYLGETGFWLVVGAAILAMLSALCANLLAASRIALTMARDNTLPSFLNRVDGRRGTPTAAIFASGAAVTVIAIVLPNLAEAGAAASMIFLISFAVAHWTNILATRRSKGRQVSPSGRILAPAVLGGALCLALAIFQGIAVPLAGVITAAWMAIGGLLFLLLFGSRARVTDALRQALDPQLARLRGSIPLVLVPIANPVNAQAMVSVAEALAPSAGAQVLLLSVVSPPAEWSGDREPPELAAAQSVVGRALRASFAAGLAPEALTTVASDPWIEIRRVARTHRCETVLLGLSDIQRQFAGTPTERLMSTLDCDVVILRAPEGWRLSEVRRILVPIGGRRSHDELRARLLGSLCRSGGKSVSYIRVLPSSSSAANESRALAALVRIAEDEVQGNVQTQVVRSDSIVAEIARRAGQSDLVILGLRRATGRQRLLGATVIQIVGAVDRPLMMISRR
jgi:basic amino acid/polyamine antiporter, APA family